MRRFLLCRPQRTRAGLVTRSLDVLIRADSPEAAVKAGARFIVGPYVAIEVDEEGTPVGDCYRRNTDAIDRVYADTREVVRS